MIELHFELGSILSFDGRVIEFFSRSDPSTRRHIAHVEVAELLVDKKQRYRVAIRMKGGPTLGTTVSSSPEAIEQAQKLVAEVERVRASL